MSFTDNFENLDIAKANIDFILLDSQTSHTITDEQIVELKEFYNGFNSILNTMETDIVVAISDFISSLLQIIDCTMYSDDEKINKLLKGGKLLEEFIVVSIDEEEIIVPNEIMEVTNENLDEIKKFNEELLKREEEERVREIAAAQKEFLLLELNNIKYAVSLEDIQEIIVFPESITKIPNLDDIILGVINQRGEVTPLIDMRLYFETKSKEDISYSSEDIVLTVKTNTGKMIGLIVDSVITVTKINLKDVSEDIPSSEVPSEYLLGITHNSQSGDSELDKETIILMNINEILSDEKLLSFIEI